MATYQPMRDSSPLADGQVKEKPKSSLTPGVVERLTLYKPIDVAIARTTVRKLADDVGYSLIDQVRLSTAIFEIADNFVTHAGQGELVIYWRDDAQRKGLYLTCNDQGLHAPKLSALLQKNGHQTEQDLSILNPKKLVDEFEFTEDAKFGNCVTMAIWLTQSD